MDEAQKVNRFLDRIAHLENRSVYLKRFFFSERELNSYLNLIYVKKYAPEVKYINLILKENNWLDGEMKIKLTGETYKKVPAFLRDFLVGFSGVLNSDNYRVRFKFKDVTINGTGFSPAVLDELFQVAQSGEKQSIYDWFTLLPGLIKISIQSGRVIVYY